MNEFMKVLFLLSVSGTLLFFSILGLKLLYRNKLSRRWQYYIWIIVVLRFLIPFTPSIVNVGKLFEALNTTVITNENPANPNMAVTVNTNDNETTQAPVRVNENVIIATAAHNTLNIYAYLLFVWSVLALVLFARKITIYQGFIGYIKAGNIEVTDIKTLNLLSDCEEKLNIKTRVELYRNALITSPIMVGFFRPSIILPIGESKDRELIYIFTHELIHHKQRDMLYKWLIQFVICVHWFNPFVYLLEKEVNKACELSCDEAVISVLDVEARREYGDMLISFLKSNSFCRSSLASVTLTEGAEQLKERLGAIMNFKRSSKGIRILTVVLTVCIIFGAALVGIYPVFAATDHSYDNFVYPKETGEDTYRERKQSRTKGESLSEAERYYEAGSLPLFQIAFSKLDKEAQNAWLGKIYEDGEIAFFSVGIDQLSADSPLIGNFAEKFYEDRSISFFSVLSDYMTREMLESWLDRALEDQETTFQVLLFDKLEMGDELEALEKEWAEKQLKEYQSVGVTQNGKNYYYQEQLVNIFLDQRPDSAFYTLTINPKGAVSIKIIRNTDGEITGVSYMTEEEVTELLGDEKEIE